MQRETFNFFEPSLPAPGHAKKVSESHPYFGYAYLLSLKNDSRDADQFAKAGLFFSNHMQLHALLNPVDTIDTSHEISEHEGEGIYSPYTPVPDFIAKEESDESKSSKEEALNVNIITSPEIINDDTKTYEVINDNNAATFEAAVSNGLPLNEEVLNDPIPASTDDNSGFENIVESNNESSAPVSPYAALPDLHLQKNADNEPRLMIEPLHASDYFASQGIKLSEDMMGNDKLGKQLKSFTAWLKTMKKITPGQTNAAAMPNAATEYAVQSLAEKSNADAEVVTEAMAEAYVVQNKKDKATEIYEKLSLLNPAKSAYFAAKIDSLK